jgi:hypothetical protein
MWPGGVNREANGSRAMCKLPVAPLSLLLAGGLLAACSGGSRSGAVAPAVSGSTTFATATATLSFTLPGTVATSRARRPAYVSPASTSLNYSATNGTNTSSQTGISLAALCTTTGASRACTVPIVAPLGNDTFTITLYASGNVLSTHTTTTAVAIAEGAANVVPPMILDPVAAQLVFSPTGSPVGTAGAYGLPLTIDDAANDPISGPGTFVANTGDVATPFAFTRLSGPTGDGFSTNGCQSQALSFASFSASASLSICTSTTKTLGAIYRATLGSATATFSTRRTQQSTGGAATTGASGSVNYYPFQWISGADAIADFAVGGGQAGAYYAYIGNYTGSSWALCSGAAAPIALDDATGTTAVAVEQGYAQIVSYTYNSGANTCTATGLSASTGSDFVALAVDPNNPTTAYGVASNFSNVGPVHSLDQVNMSTLALTNAGVQCGAALGALSAATFPASVAVGPSDTLYVGCINGLSISSYALSPSFNAAPTTIALGSSPDTGMWVAANQDVAYAVAYGTSANPIVIYTVATTSPAMVTAAYTVSNSGTSLVTNVDEANDFAGQPLAVGNDDRLYLLVSNGTVNRIVAYDPYTATLTDPGLALPSVVSSSTLQNAGISIAPNGKLLLGGYDPSSNTFSAATWPN